MAADNAASDDLIYDRAKHHFMGKFPNVLPIDQAYVHIGMFLGWVLENSLYSELFEDEAGHQIIRFKEREITAAILSAMWDGYLGEDLLNEDGNEFSKEYYQTGIYKKDYEELLTSGLASFYHVEDTWENFEKISQRIDQRYQEWKQNTSLEATEKPAPDSEKGKEKEAEDTEGETETE